jgi:hypothetical protein
VKRTLAIVVSLTMLVGIGCGKDKQNIAYRPTAFGENGQCFYAHDREEAISLQAAGLCDRSWLPTPMPAYWQARYHPYYASPAYYDQYVPPRTRTVYVQVQRDWGNANRSAIATETKRATYLGSNGKQVTADKIGATKFGGGNRFGKVGTKFGGGAGRGEMKTDIGTPATATKPASTPAPTSAPKSKATPAPKPKATPTPKSPSRPSSGGTKSYGGGGVRSSGGKR